VNRADLLLSVLRDGRPHSRQDVFDAVGFMLTNNAASELRAQGHNILHSIDGGLHTYQLSSLLEEGDPNEPDGALAVDDIVAMSPVPQAGRRPEPASPSSSGDAHPADATKGVSVSSLTRDAAPDSPTHVPGQLSLLEVA
jgi:hypothetical protein